MTILPLPDDCVTCNLICFHVIPASLFVCRIMLRVISGDNAFMYSLMRVYYYASSNHK